LFLLAQSTITKISARIYPVKSSYLYPVENVQPDPEILKQLVQTPMPFGKYKGTLICDLPVYYLEWLQTKGFPPGKLGMLLGTAFEIKTNGLSSILDMVKRSVRAGAK
jgi:uncharacterized protein (DUF3820 family)